MNSEVIRFHALRNQYDIHTYPPDTEKSTIWMRTVDRHLKKSNVSLSTRQTLFKSQFGRSKAALLVFNKRYPIEKKFDSKMRVQYTVIPHKLVSTKTSYNRGTKRARRAAKQMKKSHEDVNRATSALIRFGLLKSVGKYEQLRKIHKVMTKGRSTYGITCAQYPLAEEVTDLANAIYNHSELLTNSPDWVLKYRKGRLKLVDDQLLLPTQQITVSQIDIKQYAEQSLRIF